MQNNHRLYGILTIVIIAMFIMSGIVKHGQEVGMAECKINELYVGQRVMIEGDSYVVLTSDMLNSIGKYWLEFKRVKK